MLYAKHPNKHNNQQSDVKTILQNKQTNKTIQSMLNLEWPDIHIQIW